MTAVALTLYLAAVAGALGYFLDAAWVALAGARQVLAKTRADEALKEPTAQWPVITPSPTLAWPTRQTPMAHDAAYGPVQWRERPAYIVVRHFDWQRPQRADINDEWQTQLRHWLTATGELALIKDMVAREVAV